MITLDSSGLIALLDRNDRDHAAVASALREDAGPYVVPAGIMGEVAFMVERHLGADVLDALLSRFEEGVLGFHCGEEDIGRVRELASQFADLPLGYADASVVACAERFGGRVLTLDRRDFDVVAGAAQISVVP